MKLYGGVELQLHAFLTTAVDGDELSASSFGSFTQETSFRKPFSEYWAKWASEPDWTFEGRGKFLVRAGN
jgi:hypothetical protein